MRPAERGRSTLKKASLLHDYLLETSGLGPCSWRAAPQAQERQSLRSTGNRSEHLSHHPSLPPRPSPTPTFLNSILCPPLGIPLKAPGSHYSSMHRLVWPCCSVLDCSGAWICAIFFGASWQPTPFSPGGFPTMGASVSRYTQEHAEARFTSPPELVIKFFTGTF